MTAKFAWESGDCQFCSEIFFLCVGITKYNVVVFFKYFVQVLKIFSPNFYVVIQLTDS